MNSGARERTRLLVIGYGNTLRGDDAAGPLVAQLVMESNLPGVQALAVQQLTPELVEEIAVADRVVFVDASIHPSSASLQLEELQPRQANSSPGHCCDPRWLLALANQTHGRAPCATLMTIPATNLCHGERLSAQTQDLVQEALQIIRTMAEKAMGFDHPSV